MKDSKAEEQLQQRNDWGVFSLHDRVTVITGGAGLLGRRHAEAVFEAGGEPVLLDVSREALKAASEALKISHGRVPVSFDCDITKPEEVETVGQAVLKHFGRVDSLINNAANNPKMEQGLNFDRLENFPLDAWERDLSVGLTGAMLCSRVFAEIMKRNGNGGVILNIASDLALIAPDQRIYRREGLPDDKQPVKPVTYSVVKAGLLGLTRYCATYYADHCIRVNALAPGGVEAGQDPDFMQKLHNLIPLGRMARQDEYKGAVVFMLSDASAYMTGTCLSIDGGRTCW